MWALCSAAFAALTANIRENRPAAGRLLYLQRFSEPSSFWWYWVRPSQPSGKWMNPLELPSRSLMMLVLSALATGASWVCYFRALKVGTGGLSCSGRQAQRRPGRCVRRRVSRRTTGEPRVARDLSGRRRCTAAPSEAVTYTLPSARQSAAKVDRCEAPYPTRRTCGLEISSEHGRNLLGADGALWLPSRDFGLRGALGSSVAV